MVANNGIDRFVNGASGEQNEMKFGYFGFDDGL